MCRCLFNWVVCVIYIVMMPPTPLLYSSNRLDVWRNSSFHFSGQVTHREKRLEQERVRQGQPYTPNCIYTGTLPFCQDTYRFSLSSLFYNSQQRLPYQAPFSSIMSNHSQYSQERGHGANSNYILPIDHNGSLREKVSSQESHTSQPQSDYSTSAMPPQGIIVFGHSVDALGYPMGTLSFILDGLTWVPMPNTLGTPQGSDSFVSYPTTAITNSSSQCFLYPSEYLEILNEQTKHQVLDGYPDEPFNPYRRFTQNRQFEAMRSELQKTIFLWAEIFVRCWAKAFELKHGRQGLLQVS